MDSPRTVLEPVMRTRNRECRERVGRNRNCRSEDERQIIADHTRKSLDFAVLFRTSNRVSTNRRVLNLTNDPGGLPMAYLYSCSHSPSGKQIHVFRWRRDEEYSKMWDMYSEIVVNLRPNSVQRQLKNSALVPSQLLIFIPFIVILAGKDVPAGSNPVHPIFYM